jgi:hypothetical protein
MSPPAICCGTTPSSRRRCRRGRDPHLDALEVSQGLHFLAPPAAHLGAGVAAGEGDDVVVGVELVKQLLATTVVDPGILLAGVHAERHGGAEAEGLVLADIVVRAGMADFDRTLLHGIQGLQAGNDLAAREDADVELAAGHFTQAVGQHVGTVDGVQALREAGGQAPLDGRQFSGNGRGGQGGCGAGSGTDGSFFQKITTLHIVSSKGKSRQACWLNVFFTKGWIGELRKTLIAHSPAMVIRSIRIEPVCLVPRTCTSLPTATMPASMSLRLPAMVISSTG